MNSYFPPIHPVLTDEEFRDLAALDSCSVANAIERFQLQLHNEGYTEGELTCQFPDMPPMLGYAFTLQVRSYAPPTKRKVYFEDTRWWDALVNIPKPRVLVIQDMDRHPGYGALVDEVHVQILKCLGCIGVITNGAVRDIDRVKPLNFQMYSHLLSVSHGYSHIVSSGGRVQIGGLQINSGDILHGDRHGIIRVPRELASRIPKTAAALRQKETEITAFCHSTAFSIEELRSLLNS
jgi:4-hydroxy-4-methyl-2-oxoglutarate aldolase